MGIGTYLVYLDSSSKFAVNAHSKNQNLYIKIIPLYSSDVFMSKPTASTAGGLESIIEGAKPMIVGGAALVGALGGLYLLPEMIGTVSAGSTYAAQLGGMALGGLTGLVGGKIAHDVSDYIIKEFPTTLPQILGGGLLATGVGMALAPYGIIPMLIGGTIAYITGTGLGKFIYNKAPQTADFIKNMYEGTGLKTAYNAIAEPVVSLKEGIKTRYEEFTKNVKEFFTFHWKPKPVH